MTSTIIETSKNNRQTNASVEQKQLLLEYMKKHPKLTSGKFSNDFTLKDAQSMWQEISNILNSCGGGAHEDWKSWRKTWHDIRSRTKMKTCKLKKYQEGTGGGPHQGHPNTEYENEVLQTIKLVSIEGHTNVLESSTEFTFHSPKQAASTSNSADMGTLKENNNRDNINELPIHEKTLPECPRKKLVHAAESNSADMGTLKENNNRDNINELPIHEKTLPECPRKKLVHAAEAAENYRSSLDKKNNIKSEYYKRKIIFLERMAIAKERSATARENSVVAHERTASALEDIANNLKNLVETIN